MMALFFIFFIKIFLSSLSTLSLYRYFIRWYEYLYPNGYDDLLLSPKPMQVAAGLGGCFAYMVIFVGLATLLFARKDV